MSIPMSYDSIGNVARLSGLKNVSGRSEKRRVMPEEDLEGDFLDEEPSVEGTSQNMDDPSPLPNFAKFIPIAKNMPEPETGGAITPQSYDVRSNSVLDVKKEKQDMAYKRLGSALGDIARIKSEEGEGSEGDLASNIEGMAGSDLGASTERKPTTFNLKSKINEEFDPTKTQITSKGDAYKKIGQSGALSSNELQNSENQFSLRKPVMEEEPIVDLQAQDQASIDKAQQEGGHMVAKYGATQSFANNPDLVSSFEKYTGTNFDEQTKAETERYEKVMADIEEGRQDAFNNYDEQSRRINERILNNQATDMDKWYIGLALLMPLLIGATMGKEAGFGALGGTAKGLGDLLSNRQKDIRGDEELLSNINRDSAALNLKGMENELEKLKIPAEVRKNLPKEMNPDLIGKEIHTFKDPETGEVVARGAMVLPDIYLDERYGNTPEMREKFVPEAFKTNEDKVAMKAANEATRKMIEAVMQLKDPGVGGKLISLALADDNAKKGILDKWADLSSQTIMVDGRPVNAASYFNSVGDVIKDAYRRMEGMKAFTETVSNHVGNMSANPIKSGFNMESIIQQIFNLRDRGQEKFIDTVEGRGFIGEPMKQMLRKQNDQLYSKLNRKEESRLKDSEKLEMIKNNP